MLARTISTVRRNIILTLPVTSLLINLIHLGDPRPLCPHPTSHIRQRLSSHSLCLANSPPLHRSSRRHRQGRRRGACRPLHEGHARDATVRLLSRERAGIRTAGRGPIQIRCL